MRAIDVAATQRGGGGENDVMPERNFQKLPSAFSGYSCFNFQACSLWMSFGVYVTGVLFQTAAFVSFLLISHGYCIMCESLSLNERRSTAALACVFYLTLVGYKACVPYFSVLLLLNYFISFYIIFHHISQDLAPNFSVMPTTKCKGERLWCLVSTVLKWMQQHLKSLVAMNGTLVWKQMRNPKLLLKHLP